MRRVRWPPKRPTSSSTTEIRERAQIELEAEAEAEQIRRQGPRRGRRDLRHPGGQARGIQAILEKQAEGFAKVIAASGGNVDAAVQLMLVDKMEDLIKIQVEAVKNLNIDKVTVWDSMGGKDGTSTTANFLSGLMKSIPPLNDTFKMAGVKLPEFLVKDADEPAPESAEEAGKQ